MWSLLLVAAFVVVGLCLGASPSGRLTALALLAIVVVLGVQTWSHHLY